MDGGPIQHGPSEEETQAGDKKLNRPKRAKDLLVEVKYAAKERGRLDSAFCDVVGETASICHFVPMVEVEIMDIDLAAEIEKVEDVVRSCVHKEPI